MRSGIYRDRDGNLVAVTRTETGYRIQYQGAPEDELRVIALSDALSAAEGAA